MTLFNIILIEIDMKLNFKKNDGLVPVLVQDHIPNEVLMLAFMNEEAWEKTLSSGYAHYYSRGRRNLWKKSEDSESTQIVKKFFIDCGEDIVLLSVKQNGGAACHKGYRSCFFREIDSEEVKIIRTKVFDPEDVYKKDK